jgi:hypothetical protein
VATSFGREHSLAEIANLQMNHSVKQLLHFLRFNRKNGPNSKEYNDHLREELQEPLTDRRGALIKYANPDRIPVLPIVQVKCRSHPTRHEKFKLWN